MTTIKNKDVREFVANLNGQERTVPLAVKSFENSEGRIIEYITHDSIEKIAWEYKIKHSYNPRVCEASHAFVECIAEDEVAKRTSIGYEEVFYKDIDKSLKNSGAIATAYRHAFDNAILKLLNLPNKYLSYDEDNNSADNSDNQFDSSKQELMNDFKATNEDFPGAASTTNSENSEKYLDKVEDKTTETTDNNSVSENIVENNVEENNNVVDEEFLNTVLDFSPATGMSVREILENKGEERVQKLTNLFKMIDKISVQKQKDILLKIKSLMGL